MPLAITSCEGSLGTGDKKLRGHGSSLAFSEISPGSTRRKPAVHQLGLPGCTPWHCSAPRKTTISSASSVRYIVACSCSSTWSFFKVQMASKEHFPQKYCRSIIYISGIMTSGISEQGNINRRRDNDLSLLNLFAQGHESTQPVLRISRLKISEILKQNSKVTVLRVWLLSGSNENYASLLPTPCTDVSLNHNST